jgi:hypothetical protein
MRKTRLRIESAPDRPLWLFATLWSLRQYPTPRREWSWTRKFSEIRDAGFYGVFSPPRPELAERGALPYLALTSFDATEKVTEVLTMVQKLGAIGIDVQLGDYDMTLADAVKLAVRIRDVARELGLPFAIETHRDTFTETPEATLALARSYEVATGEIMPICLDHSHFAVVRHLREDLLWDRLREPASFLAAATQFHLRPFNGHHCQIAALDGRGRRTPEYLHWLNYTASLLAHVRASASDAPVMVVAELGNAAPAYRLSCFGDTWRDVLTVVKDLRRQWTDTTAT